MELTPLKITAFVLVAYWVIIGSSIQADKQIEAMDTYEKCVMDRSGKTPSQIYQSTGAYPECY